MATRMQQRRGTAAQWAAANPVLADGEVGYETDTKIVKFGDGAQTWNQLTPILTGQFLGASAKAADADRLDGLDSTAFLRADDVTIGRNRGSGTAWPATDLRRGDNYYHTGVAQLGYYDGSIWRLFGQGLVATLAARDALSWAYPGLQMRVSADGIVYEYMNAFLGWQKPWSEPWGELPGSVVIATTTLSATDQALATVICYIPKGRRLRQRFNTAWYTGAGTGGTIRVRIQIYTQPTQNGASTSVQPGGNNDYRIGGTTYGDLTYTNLDLPFITTVSSWYSFTAWCSLPGNPGAPVYRAGPDDAATFYVEDIGPSGPMPAS